MTLTPTSETEADKPANDQHFDGSTAVCWLIDKLWEDQEERMKLP